MLALTLRVGTDAYAIDVREVLEVIPMVCLRAIPLAPPHVAGIFSYRGTIVPVVDVCRLINGQPCQRKWNTRVVLVKHAGDGTEPYRILGLMAERVTELTRFEAGELQRVDSATGGAGYLGAVAAEGREMIQLLRVEGILASEYRSQLIADEVAQA